MSATDPARCCKIYQGPGVETVLQLPVAPDVRPPTRPTGAAEVEIRQVMCRDLVCARPDLEISAVIRLMVDKHLGCIPVVGDRLQPIGMITKFDIVEHVDAFLRSAADGSPLPMNLAARTADELMMPLAITLDESSSLANAASMMTVEDLHHVLVVSRTGSLVGVVSSKDIVTWLVRNDGVTTG